MQLHPFDENYFCAFVVGFLAVFERSHGFVAMPRGCK